MSEEHNAADVAFAQTMIAQHQQAIDVSSLVVQRASSADVRELAQVIDEASVEEINSMVSWLDTWGKEVEALGSGHGHGDATTRKRPGAVSRTQMIQLAATESAQFDQMFLEVMTAHHQGAVELAQQQLAEGINPEARDLAASIASTHAERIEQMQRLLAQG